MMSTVFRIFLLIVSFLSGWAQALERHYVVEVQALAPGKSTEYSPSLLTMILNASKAPDEVIDINFSDHHFSQSRWIAEIQRQTNVNNVMWTTTNKERESIMCPIRVPVFKGLMGLRVLVIRKEDKEKFAKVTNINELAKLSAGQGENWPDTNLLKNNKLPVVTGFSSTILYQMLQAKRFDYFPRSILEFSYEMAALKSNDIEVEDSLLLSYPMPTYFFVNKNNTELAARITKGWNIILKNGEFDKFFYAQPQIISAIAELKKHKRNVIHLTNPSLPAETPLDHPEYWFDISQYEK